MDPDDQNISQKYAHDSSLTATWATSTYQPFHHDDQIRNRRRADARCAMTQPTSIMTRSPLIPNNPSGRSSFIFTQTGDATIELKRDVQQELDMTSVDKVPTTEDFLNQLSEPFSNNTVNYQADFLNLIQDISQA